jgi:hypothetical protein
MTDNQKLFFTELAALLEKHQVEICANEISVGYDGRAADGVNFFFQGSNSDEITVGRSTSYLNADNIRRLS